LTSYKSKEGRFRAQTIY